MVAAKEIADGHSLLAGELELRQRKVAVGEGNFEIGLAVGEYRARGFCHCCFFACGRIDLKHRAFAVFLHQFCPCSGVGRHAAHEIKGAFHREIERQTTSVFENLGCVANFGVGRERILVDGTNVTRNDVIDGLCHHTGTDVAQTVVDGFDVVLLRDGGARLVDDATGVNFVVEQESGNTRFSVAVDNRPVDGGGTAILGKQ